MSLNCVGLMCSPSMHTRIHIHTHVLTHTCLSEQSLGLLGTWNWAELGWAGPGPLLLSAQSGCMGSPLCSSALHRLCPLGGKRTWALNSVR